MRRFRCRHCLSLKTHVGVATFSLNVLLKCHDCRCFEVLFYGDRLSDCKLFLEELKRVRRNRKLYLRKVGWWKMPELRFVQHRKNQAPKRIRLVLLSQMRARMVGNDHTSQLELF